MSEGRKFRYRFWTKACVFVGIAGLFLAIGVLETSNHVYLAMIIGLLSTVLNALALAWLTFLSEFDQGGQENVSRRKN